MQESRSAYREVTHTAYTERLNLVGKKTTKDQALVPCCCSFVATHKIDSEKMKLLYTRIDDEAYRSA